MSDNYLSSTTIQAFYSGTWNDISAYVVSDIQGEIGIYSADYINRLASAGSVRFTINNASGNFTPNTAFRKGTPILITSYWHGSSKTVFTGRIDSATVDVGTWGNQQVVIEALDWMDYANKQPIRANAILTNTKIGASVTSLLTNFPIQPDSTDYSTGNITFPSVFDVNEKQMASAELNDLVMSELSYIYLKEGGKTLRVEAHDTRNGLTAPATDYYINTTDSGYALNDTGDGFALGDVNSKLVVDAGDSVAFNHIFDNTFDGNEDGLDVVHGNNIINDVTLIVYPRIVGAAQVNLFSFSATGTGATAIPIPALGSYTINGNYSDPTSNSAVAGSAVVTPVITTDYLFNSKADGTGSDLSAFLSIVFTKGGTSFKSVITNTGVQGYLIKHNVRGFPVFKYSPIHTVLDDTPSKNSFGSLSLALSQPYSQSADLAALDAAKILNAEKDPRNVVLSAKFVSTVSANNMAGFMFTDIGELIHIKSNKPAVDNYFYIQGMKYTISMGGIVAYELILKDFYSFNKGLTPVAVEFTVSTRDAVNFGEMPNTINLTQRSYSVWVYRTSSGGTIMGAYNDGVGFQIYGALQLAIASKLFSTFGNWSTVDNVLTFSTWTHVVVTFDAGVNTNAPLVYINGVSKAITTTSMPTGTAVSENGADFIIGNNKTSTQDYNGVWSGSIEDARVYNRILTAAEALTLYNGGTPSISPVTDSGLVFQAFAVKTSDYAGWLDTELTGSKRVIDNIGGYIGVPIASPTVRAF